MEFYLDSGNMKGEYQDTNTESSSNIEDYTWMSLIGDQIGLYDLGVYSNTTIYTNDGEWAPMIKYNDDFFYLNYIGSVVGQTPFQLVYIGNRCLEWMQYMPQY